MTLFRTLILISFFAVAPCVAFADGLQEPSVDAIEVPYLVPTDENWAGYYGGLNYNIQSGNFSYPSTAFSYSLVSEKSAGGFVGYNWQAKNFVYGAELLAISGGISPEGHPLEEINSLIEFRGRGGYAFGKALIYGFLGYSEAEMNYSDNTKYKARGVNYGLGMDYKITSSAFAGVEVSSRNLEGCNNSTCPANLPFEASITILSFRLGYIF
ncbi:MAG: outer membrane beta-barrel protein [Amylibacter sp.]